MILDAGFLISVNRSERAADTFLAAASRSGTAIHTTEPVVGQVWRNGAKQARLAAFLKTIVVHPMDDGRSVGQLLGHSETADVVDAHLALLAVRLGDDILTSDVRDLEHLAATFGPAAPIVHRWR